MRGSREGQLQVELAQLKLLAAAFDGRGAQMSRQGGKGAGAPVERAAEAGESCVRGPGEKKLETDRRVFATAFTRSK